MARVRVLLASIDTPPIDIALEGGNVVIAALSYGQQSLPLEVPVGRYDIEFRVHETGALLLEAVESHLESGIVYDMIIHGTPGDADTPPTVAVLPDYVRVLPAEATPIGTPVA